MQIVITVPFIGVVVMHVAPHQRLEINEKECGGGAVK